MRTAIAVLIEPRTVGVSMHPDLSLSKGLACSTGWPGTKRSLVTALRAGHLGRSPLLTARLSGHQVMINGHALSPPLSFVAAIPVSLEPQSRSGARSEARTNNPGRSAVI